MARRSIPLTFLALLAAGSAATAPAPSGAVPATVRTIAIPGAPASGVALDAMAYDSEHHRVWIPATSLGLVAVVDTATLGITTISGFPTREESGPGKRTLGPSAVAQGDGMVYVGNRGNDTVCAVGADTLKRGACVFLPSTPSRIAYVWPRKEVWVTSERDKSVLVLAAPTPARLELTATLKLAGAPGALVVDDSRGLAFAALQDVDRVASVDVATRKVRDTWKADCGKDGPRGLAFDHARGLLMVACTDRVKVIDADHGGTLAANVAVGTGLDAIAYGEARHELFAAAGRAGKLIVFRVDDASAVRLAEVTTAPGASHPVVTETGIVYLTDAKTGRILVVERTAAH